MKLTSEQIELINAFLVKNEVIFDDIRYEIIDHIATDVEENYAEIPFPEAIKIVLKKWESEVRMSSSFWINSWASFPRISINKLKKLFLPQIIVICFILVANMILNLYFQTFIEDLKVYENPFKIVYILWFTVVSIFGIKLFFTKRYTTYKYVFKRNFYHIYLLTILVFFVSTIDIFMVSYLMINLSFTVFFVQNYKAHFKFIKQI